MFFVELEGDPSKQSKSSVEKPPESFSKYIYENHHYKKHVFVDKHFK